jgi:acyl dehydratase
MTQNRWFEEIVLGEGRQSQSKAITEKDIDLHAAQTGDFFPHHMDAEWCATQPFKKRMAHGTLVFSIAIGLTASDINELAMTYGYNRLRFVKPVFIDDFIKVKTTIVAKEDYKKPGFGLVFESVETFNQHNELVMVCEHVYIVQRKTIA